MKIYLIDKVSSNKKNINLGGKITLIKLNEFLNKGNTILIRAISINGGMQTDFRIHKVPETIKRDRGIKKVKAYYLVNLEVGREGFENFSPKEVSFEQNLRFSSLDRAINMLEAKQKLLRADWVIE